MGNGKKAILFAMIIGKKTIKVTTKIILNVICLFPDPIGIFSSTLFLNLSMNENLYFDHQIINNLY